MKTSFEYRGEVRPYCVASLVDLPVQELHRVVDSAELQAADERISMALCDELGVEKVRAVSLIGERIEWWASGLCEACEGDGYLYTFSGNLAHECLECDGSGEDDNDAQTVWTDMDGHIVDGPSAP